MKRMKVRSDLLQQTDHCGSTGVTDGGSGSQIGEGVLVVDMVCTVYQCVAD